MRKYSYQPYPAYQRTTNAQQQQQQNPQFIINRSTQALHQQQRPYTSRYCDQQQDIQQQQQQAISLPPTQQLLPAMPTMSQQLQLPTQAGYQQQPTQQSQLQEQQTVGLQQQTHLQLQQLLEQQQQHPQQHLANAAFAANFAALQQHQQNLAINNTVNGDFFASDYLSYDEHNNSNNNDCSIDTISNQNRHGIMYQKRHEEQQQLTQQQHMQRLQQQQQQFQLQQQQHQQQRQYSCNANNDSNNNNSNKTTCNNHNNNNNNHNNNNNNNNNHNNSNALNNQQQLHLQQLQRILLEKQQQKLQQQQQSIRKQHQHHEIPSAVNNNCSSLPVVHTSAPLRNNSAYSNNDIYNNSNSVGLANKIDGAADNRFSMDACEIANFLANELFMQQLVTMDGIQSGVPTLTTSTLTPTTLRSIEETFIQLTTDHSNPPPCQAGFIPPPVSSIQSSASPVFTGAIQNFNDIDTDDSQASWTNSQLNEENSMATTDTSSAATDSTSFPNGLNGISNASLATSNTSSKNDFTLLHNAIAADAGKHAGNLLLTTSPNNVHTSNSATTPAPIRRNQGGRRPAKSTNMSPEEEEKRRIRRERNKLAAARCRKRRVDQTNELQTEVDRLEGIRETLQKEVESLKVTKNRLAFILEAHRPTCQKIRQDLLSVHTYDGLIAPTNGGNSNDSNSNIIGVDTTLSSVGRSGSPLDLKPIILDMVPNIKNEPLDNALDSNSSLDHDGPPSPKRMLLSDNSPMLQPPLPNVATLSASLAAASASLNTPIVTTAPVSFANFVSCTSMTNNQNNLTINNNNNIIVTSNAFAGMLSAPNRPLLGSSVGIKQRPNSLPTNPRNQAQNLSLNTERPPTDINGVAIQTPSTGMFNFDSLMDGGTGLTPVSGPLVPTCSSQNKHPLELQTPTSEPSKLVSL